MIYSDEELKRWWKLKSKAAQNDLLDQMAKRTKLSDFAMSLWDQWEKGKEFSPKQLAAIRKWDYQ